jgi:hypothetical protein
MFVLVKSTEPSTAFSIGELLAYGMMAILLVVIVVSVRILMECVRYHYANPVLMGVLMLGSSAGSVLFILLSIQGIIPPAV